MDTDTLHQCSGLSHAVTLLAELGVDWDTAIVNRLMARRYDPYRGHVLVEDNGIHTYFMKDGCDVAYFTRIMNTLHVNAKPRCWSPQVLSNTRTVSSRRDWV